MQSNSSIQILTQFKNSMITFFDELIGQFPEEGDLVIARIFLKDQVPIHDVVTAFHLKINQDDQRLKKMVRERNENFFLENNVFDFVDKDKVNHFKRLWRSGRLDVDDKECIWRWVDTFITLADRYVKST